tara:strand:- start:4623 stop:6212 length:1590 start_codon:yes stop_codon:yes gene_type:complete
MRDFQLPGRSPVFGLRGAAATSHPLATGVALDILKSGGNAIDSAVAAAATLAVVEPQSTGVGGDCFALCSFKGIVPPIAINGSGAAAKDIDINWFKTNGLTQIEPESPHAITVPGALRTWAKLVNDYGTQNLSKLLKPAINYARDGYVVTPRVALDWEEQVDKLSKCPHSAKTYLVSGRSPSAGSVHRQPVLADTLSKISEFGVDEFYSGSIARDIVTYLRGLGSALNIDDFASFEPQYVKPIYTNYRGYDVYECPPNGQGITALMILNILCGYDMGSFDALGTDRFHLQAEATRLAYRDRFKYLADPEKSLVPIEKLLSESYAEELRSQISLNKVMPFIKNNSEIRHRDTVYLSVVDSDGTAVSFINSLFHPFGSGLCEPKSGVILQNRGSGFSLDPKSPNCIAPGKRPMHTIIPGILAKDNKTLMSFGVMGGHYQACGHAHLLLNLIDYKMDPQEALDAPRAFHTDGIYELEKTISRQVKEKLESRGHDTRWSKTPIGGGQLICINPSNGVLTAASEFRKDGLALSW